MKATIEIKETLFKSTENLIATTYNESGFYLNTDETGQKIYLLVNKLDGMCLWLGTYTQFKHVFENNLKPDIIEPKLMGETQSLEEMDGLVTESFALKMVSIVLNKEKYNDVG